MKKVADYPEVLVPMLLSSLFARLSGDRYYLIPLTQAQENLRGYDAKLTGPTPFTPIYMQFKRPSAYTL